MVDRPVTNVKIYYSCSDKDAQREFEKGLDDFMRKFGLSWWAGGYTFEEDRFDIAYDIKRRNDGD